jgi:hypothetical protein
MPTGFGFVVLLIAVIDQGVAVANRARNHIAATSTIATIRAAKLHAFFPAKAQAACPPCPTRNINLRLIQKFHLLLSYNLLL